MHLVMVVMMSGMCRKFHTAGFLVAMFPFAFQLKCNMTNAMLPELPANLFFDRMRIAVCYNVHGGIVVLTVHAPNVKMMDIQNTFKL